MYKYKNKKIKQNDFFNKVKAIELPVHSLIEGRIATAPFEPTVNGLEAIILKYHFQNGFGASLIRHLYSYGQELDLFELAVISKRENWNIDYDSPFSLNVEGHLTIEQVKILLNEIENYNGSKIQ